jgi:phosphopantetheinyl transferase
MKPVFISFSHSADRLFNLRRAFDHAGLDFAKFQRFSHAKNGKPILVLNPTAEISFSISHCKNAELIALLNEDREIGIDIEVLPESDPDPDFLKTIASKEDHKIVRMLGSNGAEASIALWVLKEAALKCTGEVMTDPLHLSVAHISRNLFRVKSSASAGAPHPEIDVCLHVLTNETNTSTILLVGLAMPAGVLINYPIHFAAEGWKVAKYRQ